MRKKKIKIIFAGSTQFSFMHLKNISFTKHKIKAILTKKIKKFKKNNDIQKFSKKYNIPYFTFHTLENSKTYKIIHKFKADLLIVVAYGLLIPEKILKLFPLGAINFHASILPQLRGAAPIQWAILLGKKETGVSAFFLNKNLDSGKIICSLKCPIEKKETYSTLSAKLVILSLNILHQILSIFAQKITPYSNYQNKKLITYAPKIFKKQTQLYWTHSAKKLDRQIRAFYPSPNSFFFIKKIRIKVLKTKTQNIKKNKNLQIGEIIKANKKGIYINTKKNILILKKIQIQNKKSLYISDILNSKKKWFLPGTIL